MTYKPTTLLTVHLDSGSRHKVGRLAADGRRILFEYDPAFLGSGLDISPFHLGLQPNVHTGNPAVFDGLFGVFNDSLPDGWGRLLLDRAVERQGVNRGQLTPLDRLAHVGLHGMGALTYEPDLSGGDDRAVTLDLARLAADAATVLAGEEGEVIETLLKLNGGSAGARPKVVAQVSADRSKIIHGPAALPDGYRHWMIKFPSVNDSRDAGPVEYAYALMARDAGLAMPATHLFRTRKKQRFFGIERFDRDGDRRIHMHSLSGLMRADHRLPAIDYDGFLKVTLLLTKDVREVEKAFAIACFNVLAHNRDDHSKNVSFLMDDAGAWTLAPAYDLTFSFGPGGEQSMMVMGEGKAPGIAQLRALGTKHGLRETNAIIDRVRVATVRWRIHADAAGVTKKAAATIANAIAAITPPEVKPAAKQKRQDKKASPAKAKAKVKATPPAKARKPSKKKR